MSPSTGNTRGLFSSSAELASSLPFPPPFFLRMRLEQRSTDLGWLAESFLSLKGLDATWVVSVPPGTHANAVEIRSGGCLASEKFFSLPKREEMPVSPSFPESAPSPRLFGDTTFLSAVCTTGDLGLE